MAFNVAEFRANMVGDGARPNLFAVSLTFPNLVNGAVVAGQKTTFMAKAAQIPGSTINSVTVPYFGRELKFAGNRSFADWTITVINDEDFLVRNAVESWMNAINSHAGNLRNSQAINPSSYTVDAEVIDLAGQDVGQDVVPIGIAGSVVTGGIDGNGAEDDRGALVVGDAELPPGAIGAAGRGCDRVERERDGGDRRGRDPRLRDRRGLRSRPSPGASRAGAGRVSACG